LGGTLDDAAGEAFDKTARILGLSNYLGGVLLSQKAAECPVTLLKSKLPRPMLDQDNFDFSFSGLKTAVKRLVEKENPPIAQVACDFQEAVVDVLVAKTIRAAKKYNVKSILVGGGVAANALLRSRLQVESAKLAVPLFIPPLRLCTDNAVYIAAAAYFNYKPAPFEHVAANPSLGIMDLA
jgi:N6-L-threonylcarbamoyladenine synthase